MIRQIALVVTTFFLCLICSAKVSFVVESRKKDELVKFFEETQAATGFNVIVRNGILFTLSDGTEYGKGIQFLLISRVECDHVVWVHEETYLQDVVYDAISIGGTQIKFDLIGSDTGSQVGSWTIDVPTDCQDCKSRGRVTIMPASEAEL